MRRSDGIRRGWSRRGFTLIEIVITLAIVLILTALGVGMSDQLIPRFRTRKAALEFMAKVQQCRSVAIRTGRECSIWLFPGDSNLSDPSTNTGEYWVGVGDAARNSTTWDYLPEDSETDGSDDDTSQGIIDLGDPDGDYYAPRVAIDYTSGTLGGPGVGNSDRIVFNARGFVTNPDTDFDSNGTITVTFVNKMARSKGITEDYKVIITRPGMVRVDTSVADTFNGMTAGTTESSSVN